MFAELCICFCVWVFAASVSLCCSSHDNLSTRVSSVLLGGCFCCSVSCALFYFQCLGCCYYALIYFWRTRAILLPYHVYIYSGGDITFWRLNSISWQSLVSDPIYGCINFWIFLAILFIDLFIFQIRLLIILTLCSKHAWPLQRFIFFYSITPLYIFHSVFLFFSPPPFWYFVLLCYCLSISSCIPWYQRYKYPSP